MKSEARRKYKKFRSRLLYIMNDNEYKNID